jgi:gluconolactonase
MTWSFELVAGPYGERTDGPVWDGTGVVFASNGENAIRRFDPSSFSVSVFRPHWIRIRGLAFDAQGTLFGCQSGSRRIVRFNGDGSASPLRARLDGQLHNCPDDLAIDRTGRIWFSDPYDPVPPRGPHIRPFLEHQSVLRLERIDSNDSWRLQRMTFDTRCPRGIALSPDEHTLYVADSEDDPSGTHEVRAYPVQPDGTLGAGRVFHRFSPEYRGVDGLRLDREGNVLACVADDGAAGAICVISPSGTVQETHVLPSGQPTSCAFGDPGREALYVTTSEGNHFRVANTGHGG